ncbi:hypothetical protein AAG570_006597 [Ranatra chinensis]|uniref:Sodium/bile acid cotransporter 7 n=1 Tax=Ranatra chinensis TaxID=642074 RepID=A0ABD0YUT1_9HEMI
MRAKEIIKRNWFLCGILGCILAAEVFPSLGKTGGLLKPEWTVKYGAVGIIFLTSGLSLSINDVLAAGSKYRLHLFIQTFTFVCIPIMILIFNLVLNNIMGINEWILKGLATVSCMPPPVSSAVILTKAVGGNEAAAVFNSVIGSFLGIIITPLTLLFFLGSTAIISVLNSVVMLGQTVVIPLLLGLAIRHFRIIRNLKLLPLSTVGQSLLLFIIYTTFCDAFVTHDIPMNATDVLISVVLVVVIQIGLLYISFHISLYLKWYSPGDVVAITFCSTHKSLTLGVPILRILFSGYAHFSQITLPLLIYHPTQIILGGLMVPPFKKWMMQKKSG